MLQIVAFLVVIGPIIFLHELGHHLLAKAFGVRVHIFSLGFGKRIVGFVHKGTDYRISAVPLGGYVRMGGELFDEATGEEGEFLSKPRWQRILVYLAGPAMNIALAIVLVALAFMGGIPVQGLQDLPPVVGRVLEDGPAERAGFEIGDRVVRVGDEAVDSWDDLGFVVSTAPGKTLDVVVDRGGTERTLQLVPDTIQPEGYGDAGIVPAVQVRLVQVVEGGAADRAGLEAGDAVLTVDGRAVASDRDLVSFIEPRAGLETEIEVRRGDEVLSYTVVPQTLDDAEDPTAGKLNVLLGFYRKLPPLEALGASVRYNIDTLAKIGQVLRKLVTRDIAAKSALSGPIEIARMSADAMSAGLEYLIFFTGFLSLSIGVMNLLPIPILDGGHILFLLIESVTRRDLSLRVKELFLRAGFLFLVVLMATVIFFDLSKRFPALLGGS